jgi:hypothetical protein
VGDFDYVLAGIYESLVSSFAALFPADPVRGPRFHVSFLN